MKLPCAVIQDLLPLYAEGLTSEVSKTCVEEHLPACAHCRSLLEEMKKDRHIAPPTDAVPLQLVKQRLRRRAVSIVALTVCLTAAVALIVLGRMTAPEAVSESAVAFSENNNGFFSFRITNMAPEGTALQMEYFTDEGGRNCVAVSPYTSPWLRIFGKNTDGTIITTSRCDLELAFYCNQRKSGTLRQLYPMQAEPNLGAVLPRLVLNYYLWISVAMTLLSVLFWLFLHKKTPIPGYTVLLFTSYILSHLSLKGFGGASYFLLQDLIFILLTTAALFGAVCSAIVLYRLRKGT